MALSEVVPGVEVERSTPVVSLDEHRAAIFETLNTAVLDIGAHLIAAKRDHHWRFTAWVETELPWGLDTAERYMAVTRAFGAAPPEMRAALPRPYTVLFALTRLDPDTLAEAIETGVVHPGLTHAEACALARDPAPLRDWQPRSPTALAPRKRGLDANLFVTHLLARPRAELADSLAEKLRGWLDD